MEQIENSKTISQFILTGKEITYRGNRYVISLIPGIKRSKTILRWYTIKYLVV